MAENNEDAGNERRKFCPKCCLWKPLYAFRTGKSNAGHCKKCSGKKFYKETIECPHCLQKIAFVGVTRTGITLKTLKKRAAKKYEGKDDTTYKKDFFDK